MLNPRQKESFAFRCLTIVINVCFIVSFLSPVRALAQSPAELGLPIPGTMISLTENYVPMMVKGLRVHPENPILFDFIVDTGNSGLSNGQEQLKTESEKLIKYFLASLTIPEENLWVNLSPYEKDRIIPNELGQTDMGRDMLAQDYILKQLTASLIYPEKELGKAFWNKVYAKAQALYGSTEIPVNTFNKVWIVADKAKVFVHDNTAFVVASHLKVMLEEDYLASQKQTVNQVAQDTNNLGSQIVRDIVLPELEKEVNTGKNFANLRQIFHSMILAAWYKKNLKDALLNQVYSNKAKVNGVDTADKTIKEKIYKEYLKAYKKGVFNYIKEDVQNGQVIPRKYFSGGVLGKLDLAQTSNPRDNDAARFIVNPAKGRLFNIRVTTPKSKTDLAMRSSFELDTESIRRVSNVFAENLITTLNGKSGVGGVSYLNSYFKPANGRESGDYIGVDFSGTNLKIVLVRMQPGQKPTTIQQIDAKFPEELKMRTSADVFSFVASKIKELPLETSKDYKIGLSFAFPMSHQSMGGATVLRLAKGWELQDIQNKNPGALLETALNNRKLEVVGVLNDTIATQLASPGAVSGIILGTGSNFSITDAQGNIINLEAGSTNNIPESLRTESDEVVLRDSEPQGKQMFEKMISGKYLVQLLRENIRNLAKSAKEGNYLQIAQSSKWDDLESVLLGKLAIANDKLELISLIKEYLGEDISVSEAEAFEMQNISQTLLKRSGLLLGSAIAQVLKNVTVSGKKKIVIDGSVYWKNELVKQGFEEALKLEGFTPEDVEIVKVENASAVGAAVAAAVASRLLNEGDIDGGDVPNTSVTEDIWQQAENVGLSRGRLLLEFQRRQSMAGAADLRSFVLAKITTVRNKILQPASEMKDLEMEGIWQQAEGAGLQRGKLLEVFRAIQSTGNNNLQAFVQERTVEAKASGRPKSIEEVSQNVRERITEIAERDDLNANTLLGDFYQWQSEGGTNIGDFLRVRNLDRAMVGKPIASLEKALSDKVISVKASIQPLLDAYYQAVTTNNVDEVKRLDGEINKIVDGSNIYAQSKADDLKLADDVVSLSSFLSSDQAAEFQQHAKNTLLNGAYIPQFIFAGAATRLKRGPMYGLDIWELAQELGKASATDAKLRLGMGPRQILAYRLAIEQLAKDNKRNIQEVLTQQKIIVNVNADIEKDVLEDFIRNNFYGFSPANIFFVVQPTFHGFKFNNGVLEFDPNSPTVPYGHGHNFMQLAENGQAFRLDSQGQRKYITGALIDEFSDFEVISSHRINDLTKFSKDSVVSIDKIAFALAQIDRGYGVVGELVNNPSKQKGGNVLKNTKTGRSFLIETSNVKASPALVGLLDEAGKKGAPYNAFRLVYAVDKLRTILKNQLPFNLRFKDGYFYLEAVTGDVTQLPSTKAAFVSSGEDIHDLKEPKNIDDGVAFLKRSDEELIQSGLIKDGKFNSDAAMVGTNTIPSSVQINPRVFQIGDHVSIINKTGRNIALEDFFEAFRVKYGLTRGDTVRLDNVEIEINASGTIKFSDNAMATKNDDTKGGIDLNSKNMKIDVDGQKIDIRFDPAMIKQFQAGDFSGVRPVILNITPIVDMRPLLGLVPGREELLAKV